MNHHNLIILTLPPKLRHTTYHSKLSTTTIWTTYTHYTHESVAYYLSKLYSRQWREPPTHSTLTKLRQTTYPHYSCSTTVNSYWTWLITGPITGAEFVIQVQVTTIDQIFFRYLLLPKLPKNLHNHLVNS